MRCAKRLGLVTTTICLLFAVPAHADNCSAFTDCFGSMEAAILALLGLLLLILLLLWLGPIIFPMLARLALGTLPRLIGPFGRLLASQALRRISYNFASRFAGQTANQIAQGLARSGQTPLLRQFLGTGARGAQNALRNFRIPQGLTREALEAYHEIARRLLLRRWDYTQALRLRLVERALRMMQ